MFSLTLLLDGCEELAISARLDVMSNEGFEINFTNGNPTMLDTIITPYSVKSK